MGPVFFPAQGSLGHATIDTDKRPVQALEFVVSALKHMPETFEDSSTCPTIEPVVRRTAFAQACRVERLPLNPCSPHEHDCRKRSAWICRLATSTTWMRVAPLRYQRLHHSPQFITHSPSIFLAHAKFQPSYCSLVQPFRTEIIRIGSKRSAHVRVRADFRELPGAISSTTADRGRRRTAANSPSTFVGRKPGHPDRPAPGFSGATRGL